MIEIVFVVMVIIVIVFLIIPLIYYPRLKQENQKLKNYIKQLEDKDQHYRHLVEQSNHSASTFQQELQRTKEELQDLFTHVDGALWSKDLITGELSTSFGTEQLFGYSLSALEQQLVRGETIYLEDTDLVQNYIHSISDECQKLEFRIVKNDEIRWIHSSSTPVSEKNGEPTKVLGILFDITESKLAEEKLKESEERYRLLQESIDYFSKDLFKVMNISDLEDRFILELKQVLKVENICIIEIDDRLNLIRCTGGSADFHETVLLNYFPTIPIGDITAIEQGCFVKIGEANGRIILLCIENRLDVSELMPQRLWLQTISRHVSVLYENLFTIEDLAKELEESSKEKSTPKWLLRLLFHLAEKERMRFSADLHDSVLQNQILWYRKLEMLRSDSSLPAQIQNDIWNIEQGLLDVIQQIRVTCNNLRPPYLKEQGLIKAFESLFAHTRVNVDFIIEFNYSDLKHSLSEEEMITLYRVTQELLANARKHSQATKVDFTISSIDDNIYFNYQDNGVGMDIEKSIDSFEHIGISGIKKRVDSIEGEIELYSTPGRGVNMLILIPTGEKHAQISSIFEVFT